MKKNGKRLLALVLALALVLSMNTGIFADTVSKDAAPAGGVETPAAEAGTEAAPAEDTAAVPETEAEKAEEPSAAEKTEAEDVVSENLAVSEDSAEAPVAVSTDSAEEPAGDQFPAPESVSWVTEKGTVELGNGKSVQVKPGDIVVDEVEGADTIHWVVKNSYSQDVIVSGDAVYDNSDQVKKVIIEKFRWSCRTNGTYTVYAKTKGNAIKGDSYETFSLNNLNILTDDQQMGMPIDVSYNYIKQEVMVKPFSYSLDAQGNTLKDDTYCLTYCYDGGSKVFYEQICNSDQIDENGYKHFDVPWEAVKIVKEKEIVTNSISISACALHEDMTQYRPSEWQNCSPVDFNGLISLYDDPPTGLEITGNPGSLGVGRSVALGVKVLPEKVRHNSVSWSSAYPEIATVDQSGRVTGLKEGKAVISVNSVSAPTVVSSCQIEIVPIRLSSIKFDKSNYGMFPGQTGVAPKITFNPSDAPNKGLTFESSKPEVAVMDEKENRFIAYSAGTTTITARSKENPSVFATCTVTVNSRGGMIIDQGTEKMYRWTVYESGTLVIESMGGRNLGSRKPWADYIDMITNIEFEGSFERLDGKVLYDMPALKSVTLPENFSVIKQSGYFHNCPMLEKIYYKGQQYEVVNDNVLIGVPMKSKISGRSVLLGTKTATELPKDVEGIGGMAFYGQSIPYVVIPANINTIGRNAFSDCKQLTFIVIENPGLTLEAEAFTGCTNLKDVYFTGNAKEWQKLSGKSKILKSANVHMDGSLPELCTVSFNSSGGSEAASLTAIKGNTISSLPKSYKDKFVLEGWYQDEALTKPFVENETKVEGNTMLYAKWRDAKQLTVVFNGRRSADGFWVEFDRQTVYEEQYVDSKTPSYSDITADFAGWYRDEALRNSFSTRIQRVTEDLCVNGVLTLYAKWSSLTPAERETEIADGVTLAYDIEYTTTVSYDGRSHVVGEYGGKTLKKESVGVNPDIFVENFVVYLNGEELSGITIKNFSYKNNILPSYDGAANSNIPMYIYPVLNYDSKDERLKEILSTYKNLKSVLGKMMKPALVKTKDEDGNVETYWNYEPLTVTITRIPLTADTEVYTTKELKADPNLKNKDGILVWNGGYVKFDQKKIRYNDDGEIWYDVFNLKATIPGLYYQKVFMINGRPKVKKLTLRPGGRAYKLKRWKEDGEWYSEVSFPMTSTAFDYYLENEQSDTPRLNDSEWETTYDKDDNPLPNKVKMGNFTGTLPSFPVPETE